MGTQFKHDSPALPKHPVRSRALRQTWHRDRVHHRHMLYSAQSQIPDLVYETQHSRHESEVMVDAHFQSEFLRQVPHILALFQGYAERLFDEHVAACVEALRRGLTMCRGRE